MVLGIIVPLATIGAVHDITKKKLAKKNNNKKRRPRKSKPNKYKGLIG